MSHWTETYSGRRRAKSTIAVATLCFVVWVMFTVVSPLPSHAAGGGASSGDPQRGEELFQKRCGGCHTLDLDKEGPRLRDVYGRKAGSISSFKYSDALKSSQVSWDEASLNKWLTNTESLVPDNDMDFHVASPDERADIIRFLRVSSGK
jgi:cytochrome c